jgi:non-canonical (house-cleaning) NTP pyrophosphatase
MASASTKQVVLVSAAVATCLLFLLRKKLNSRNKEDTDNTCRLRFYVLGGKYYQKLGEVWNHDVKDFVVLYRPMYHCSSKLKSFEAHVLAVRNFDDFERKFKPCSFGELSQEAKEYVLYQPSCWMDKHWTFSSETAPVINEGRSGLIKIRSHEQSVVNETMNSCCMPLVESKNVVIATKGKHKVNALNDALKSILMSLNRGTVSETTTTAVTGSGSRILPALREIVHYIDIIHAEAAPSLINEQPWGFEETLTGARNRLQHVKSIHKDKLLYCAIENGLVQLNESIYDFAWVIVEMKIDDKYYKSETLSAMVKFPTQEGLHVLQEGLSTTTTVGSLLSLKYPDLDMNDPHQALTSFLSCRTSILKEAILISIGQLNNSLLS